jgi:hypothetical protein
MQDRTLFIGLFSAWAVVSAIWIALMIYRGIVGLREEDQVFLHKGEESLVREQKEIAAKLKRISPHLIWSGTLSVILLLALGFLFLYRGWSST